LAGLSAQFEDIEDEIHVCIAEGVDIGGAGSPPTEPAGLLQASPRPVDIPFRYAGIVPDGLVTDKRQPRFGIHVLQDAERNLEHHWRPDARVSGKAAEKFQLPASEGSERAHDAGLRG
jgi:hypothetical protein